MTAQLVFLDLRDRIGRRGTKFNWVAGQIGVDENTVHHWVNRKRFPKKSEHLAMLVSEYGPLLIQDRGTGLVMKLEVANIDDISFHGEPATYQGTPV